MHIRGIGRYLLQLIHGTGPHVEWVVFADRPDLPLHVQPRSNVAVKVFDLPGHRFHSWEQMALPAAALAQRCDALFCPATTASAWQPVPTIVTLHDVTPWTTDEDGFPPGFYRDKVLPIAYRRAAAIICPSKSAASDATAMWPVLTAKLRTIPHGIDEAYLSPAAALPGVLQDAGVRPPYLVYVGGEIPRKRMDWALRVWQSLRRSVPLVLCGVNPPAHEEVRRQLAPERRDALHLLPFVPEEDMPALYANAAAVLYPSSYEGFGFPVLEAQACGTPVLFSAVGSLAELIGPFARVLPPDDLEGWVDACEAVLGPGAVGADERERSRAWARGFSWARSVEAHLDVLLRHAATAAVTS